MANYDKWTRGGVGHLAKHFERAKDENGEYVKFGNRDIDTERTHLNYNLAPERPEGQYQFIKKRCEDLHCLNRKDVNVLSSWIVTAPADLPDGKLKDFFQASYDALEKKYGKDNVVSAYVHMDESGRPHMHFAFVPVVYDKAKDRSRVNAKKCVTRADLQAFHPWLEAELTQRLGFHVAMMNEATKDGNKTITEMKRERELARQREEAARTSEAIQERQKVEGEVNTLRSEKNALKDEKTALEGVLEPLREVTTDIRDLDENHAPVSKSLFGGKETYTAKDAEFIRNAAKYSYKARYEKTEAQRLYENEKFRHEQTISNLKRVSEKSRKLEDENRDLKKDNKLMEDFIRESGSQNAFREWRRQLEEKIRKSMELMRHRGRGGPER